MANITHNIPNHFFGLYQDTIQCTQELDSSCSSVSDTQPTLPAHIEDWASTSTTPVTLSFDISRDEEVFHLVPTKSQNISSEPATNPSPCYHSLLFGVPLDEVFFDQFKASTDMLSPTCQKKISMYALKRAMDPIEQRASSSEPSLTPRKPSGNGGYRSWMKRKASCIKLKLNPSPAFLRK
ncbi:hypothetical protein DSO57_1012189 [Entomophthora muscae]|uniref:Uncharacterized protein n=1 Tax=Entomophthora muscae TaxID=34485 RepID=A0ACC2UFG7_9FUNG|nr:hypothetical protein DSO57_1012189 [Entomophthora muscae]